MEYLNYRIYWLREQGFDETQTDLNHFGGKYINKNTYVSYWDDIEKNEFILLSTLLSELIYLRHLCSISLYGTVCNTEHCYSYSITKRDNIKQKNKLFFPIIFINLSIHIYIITKQVINNFFKTSFTNFYFKLIFFMFKLIFKIREI